MSPRLLVVEDEEAIAIPLVDRLRSEGYQVDLAADGQRGLELASSEPYALIVLDLMLPRKGGLEVCRDLRQLGVSTPILMLTAKGQLTDKVVGLRLGADDYLTKPFEPAELLARIEALLRRSANSAAPAKVFELGPVRVDVRRAEVLRDGQKVALSPKEFQLLRYFAEHPGEALSREEILKEVWDYDATISTRTVDVHVSWLRQKLEEDPRVPKLIQTVVGLGYKLNA